MQNNMMGRRRTTYYQQPKKSSAGSKGWLFLFLSAVLIAVVSYFYINANYICVGQRMLSIDSTKADLSSSNITDITPILKLKKLSVLDLRDNAISLDDYEALKQSLPECEILWSVPFSCGNIDSHITSVSIPNATAEDLDNLSYLKSLTSCDLTGCTQYDRIMELYTQRPECKFTWEVEICGKVYPSDTDIIVLSNADAEDIAALRYLPNLRSVDASSCTLYEQLYEIYSLKEGKCEILWYKDFLGTKVASTERQLDISNTKITDFDEFFDSVKYIPGLDRLTMCDCGLSNEQMEKLCAAYPKVKFVWRVYFGRWSLRTDATIFSTLQYDPPTGMLTSKDIEVLKYCTDLEMLDLGHNAITDISCLSGLTKMKVLILADNKISDISPIAGMTDLFYVEMFINRISDISVLKNMPKLEQVNFCWNYRITDPSVLYDKSKLEKIWMCGSGMSYETKKELRAALPDCEFDLTSTWGSTNGSWRTNDTYHRIKNAFKQHNGSSDHLWDDK